MSEEEINQNEILYNQLYERTKNFGRTQFIIEIMRLERENQRLKEHIEDLKEKIENSRNLFMKHLSGMLSKGIEPDPEDFYLAEIEEKANNCYKYKQALNEIRKVINECKMLMPHEFDWEEQAENILQIIDKALGDEK